LWKKKYPKPFPLGQGTKNFFLKKNFLPSRVKTKSTHHHQLLLLQWGSIYVIQWNKSFFGFNQKEQSNPTPHLFFFKVFQAVFSFHFHTFFIHFFVFTAAVLPFFVSSLPQNSKRWRAKKNFEQ